MSYTERTVVLCCSGTVTYSGLTKPLWEKGQIAVNTIHNETSKQSRPTDRKHGILVKNNCQKGSIVNIGRTEAQSTFYPVLFNPGLLGYGPCSSSDVKIHTTFREVDLSLSSRCSEWGTYSVWPVRMS